MGTAIQTYNLTEDDYKGKEYANHSKLQKGNNDLLTVTQPQIIREIYNNFFDAGADIIQTNTFSSTSVGMEDFDMCDEVDTINNKAVKLAKETAEEYTQKTPDKPRFVGASVGPTNKTCSLSPDVNRPEYRAIYFDELKDSYQQQIEIFVKNDVDVLMIETIFDTLNAKAAIIACNEVNAKYNKNIPLWVSGTITDASGRTLSGQTLEAFVITMAELEPAILSLNCSLGAKLLYPYVKQLRKLFEGYVACYPNAGLPNAFGEYDQTPEQMAEEMKPFLDNDLLNLLGGYCGSTPAHINALHNLIENGK